MGFFDSLFGGGGSSSAPQTVTQTVNNEPPAFQKPFLEHGFNEARRIYDGTQPQYFNGSTVVGHSPQSEQALAMTEARALAGSDLQRSGSDYMQNAISGNFLGSGGNPHLQGAFDAAVKPMVNQYQDVTAPGIDSAFAGAGRYGSGSYAQARNRSDETFANALADTGSELFYNDYGQERQMQHQAAGMAPQYAQADYADAQNLAGVGAAREGLAQAQLSDEVNRHNFNQNREANKLAEFMGMVNGGYGSSGTTSTPVFNNPAANFLGSAATGAGIGNMIGGGAGAGIGAGIGGLLGMF